MAQAPTEKLVPGNSLITATAEEGRALAITLARHSIQAMQHDEDVLKSGRAQYANDPLADRRESRNSSRVRHDRCSQPLLEHYPRPTTLGEPVNDAE